MRNAKATAVVPSLAGLMPQSRIPCTPGAKLILPRFGKRAGPTALHIEDSPVPILGDLELFFESKRPPDSDTIVISAL